MVASFEQMLPRPRSLDWRTVLRQVAISRALDDVEETRLVPERKVLYQFSARGHDLTQVLLSAHLTGAKDGVGAYYRSRPLLLGLGLPLKEALASTMMRAGSMSEGRDIGVVFNMPRKKVSAYCQGAVGSAPSTRPRLAGLRRCAIAPKCSATRNAGTASRWRMAETLRRPRTVSGPRSISSPPSNCRSYSSSKTTATVSQCPHSIRRRAATLPGISRGFADCAYSTATAPTHWPRPTSLRAR